MEGNLRVTSIKFIYNLIFSTNSRDRMIQNRNIQLNLLEPTNVKSLILNTLFESYNLACSDIFNQLLLLKGITQTELHHATYKTIRDKYKLPADYTISARVTAWNRRKLTKQIKTIPVRLTNKLFRYKQTPRGNPIIAMTSFNRKRFVLPIKQDNTFKRFKEIEAEGYNFNSLLLIKKNKKYILQVVMQKDFPIPQTRPNTIGIDIGSANLCAISILDSGKRIVKQLYFGRDVAIRQHKISNRRALLQSKADKGSSKAIKALKRIRRNQRNFVNTRSWQVATDVVKLALKYNANISIEDLKRLKTGRRLRNSKGKKVNKLINRIPYARFFHALDCIALRNNILVSRVTPHYTSQRCYKCGNITKKNLVKYSLFRCVGCGFTAHRDRLASVNVANPVLERKDLVSTANSVQTSKTEDSVTSPVCVDEIGMFDDVHLNVPLEAKSPHL